MKRRRFLTVTIGALVLGGLLGAADAPAAPSELPGITQNSGQRPAGGSSGLSFCRHSTDDAVLDKATGLVWEKSPQTTSCQMERGPSHLHREKCRRSERLAVCRPSKKCTQSGGFFRRSSRSWLFRRAIRFWLSSRLSIGRRRGLVRIPRARGACISA